MSLRADPVKIVRRDEYQPTVPRPPIIRDEPNQEWGIVVPVRVEPRGTHWARTNESYDDRFLFLLEAVGRLAAYANEYQDPNSPWTHEGWAERVREVERHAKEWADDIDALLGADTGDAA